MDRGSVADGPGTRHLATAGLLLFALLVSSGCASSTSTSGVFKSYKESFARAEAAAQGQSLSGAEAVFAPDAAREDGAGLLANLELGAFSQAFGEFDRSRERFDRADLIARSIEQRAVVSGRAVGRNLGAMRPMIASSSSAATRTRR